MDSLTQIALGGTLAAALVPAGHRRRALVYGAALGTLPDLDVLIHYGNPVADFTYHRSFSHSLFVLSGLAPLLWWICGRFDAAMRAEPWRWLLAFWLALVTHPLLDAMTIYGTQLLWPFDHTPYGVGSVFIIDPLYTLPLLVAMVWTARRPFSIGAQRSLPFALALSSVYLGWSALAQQHVEAHARQAIDDEQAELLALPSAFNTLLWRVLVREPGGYREAYLSLLVDQKPGPWRYFKSEDQLIPQLEGSWAFERLRWFTHGYYAIQRDNDAVTITDLRMGSEPVYVFRFDVARFDGEQIKATETTQRPGLRPVSEAIRWLAQRVFTPGQGMPPPDEVLGKSAKDDLGLVE